jgi:hypothetical protein
MGKYLICYFTDGGLHNVLARDYDLPRAKNLADRLQENLANQIKVLEETPKGYRIAYTCKNPPLKGLVQRTDVKPAPKK